MANFSADEYFLDIVYIQYSLRVTENVGVDFTQCRQAKGCSYRVCAGYI